MAADWPESLEFLSWGTSSCAGTRPQQRSCAGRPANDATTIHCHCGSTAGNRNLETPPPGYGETHCVESDTRPHPGTARRRPSPPDLKLQSQALAAIISLTGNGIPKEWHAVRSRCAIWYTKKSNSTRQKRMMAISRQRSRLRW